RAPGSPSRRPSSGCRRRRTGAPRCPLLRERCLRPEEQSRQMIEMRVGVFHESPVAETRSFAGCWLRFPLDELHECHCYFDCRCDGWPLFRALKKGLQGPLFSASPRSRTVYPPPAMRLLSTITKFRMTILPDYFVSRRIWRSPLSMSSFFLPQ